MPLERTQAQAIEALIQGAKRVLCLCHHSPDGDALGSLIGLGLLIEERFPNVSVTLHCVDPVPETFHFLSAAPRVQPLPSLLPGDVVLFLDAAEPKLTGVVESHPTLFDGTVPTVVFDHHPDNPAFGRLNLVVPSASSTCEVVTLFAEILEWKFTVDAATALLTGLYTDTGGLLHSNTTAMVYRTVARLLRHGARQQQVVQAVFRTAKLSTLKLWGRVLEKISVSEEGGAISAVTEGDFRASGAEYSELTGAIDYVNAVPGMRFSMILHERGGKVKGSIRTLRDDVDVSAMAGAFQGGGHRKAAGFSLPGKLKPEVRWKVVGGGQEHAKESDAAVSLN